MRSPSLPSKTRLLFPWPIEWFLYLVATANILLVIFDISYFSLRDVYLTNDFVNLKPLVQLYDPIKAVEPNRFNAHYVDTAQELIDTYRENQQDPRLTPLLKSLREQSKFMINNDPYARVGKTGVLERLKNRMRKQMGLSSATQSFEAFWSEKYLSNEAINFYETKMKPLLEANYFRAYGEDGEFVDQFWRIDQWFIGIFALELVLRALYLSRKWRIRYQDALALRWYDFFWLTFTVHWEWLRLLRFIPYTIRSYQLGAPFSKVVDYINDRYLQWVAERVSDLVVVQLIEELEETVRRNDFAQLLANPNASPSINRINQKLSHFLENEMQGLANNVLPAVEPEVVRLLQHIVRKALSNTPGYGALKPFLGRLPEVAVEQFVPRLSSTVLQSLQGIGKTDPETQGLVDDLVFTFSQRLAAELSDQQTLGDLKDILLILLEDTKNLYLNRSTRTLAGPASTELTRLPKRP